MKQENINNKVLNDLANRIDNWDKLEGVPERVDVLETDATEIGLRVDKNETDIIKNASDLNANTFKIKNEIVNGDFSDGGEKWTVGLGITDATFSNRELGFTGVGSHAISSTRAISQKGDFNDTDLFYITLEFKSTGDFYAGIGYHSITLGTSNEYKKASAISTNTVAHTGQLSLSSLGGSSVFVKNIQTLNLTQVFGAGNEPTKEEMDLLILQIGYINGEITLTQKQILNWQLGLIRKNTRAIISLGGTIS